ncbi:MAG: 50S ribosomal protein L18Ae [Candidatus Thermoplasmatota archaeon]|jgi:large subunit ribosomal protein LX|nr:50S ribosomal protein L18Ae [Candidatus Thermoplasmatota archaeon]
MKAFRANGSFRAGKRNQQFTVDVVAENEDDAIERIFSNFGSRHRAPRRFVNIESISEIDPSESTSPTVVAHFADQ